MVNEANEANEGILESPGVTMYATTKRREFWGWFCSMAWLFFMLYGVPSFEIEPVFSTFFLGGYLTPFIFGLVFISSIIIVGFIVAMKDIHTRGR